MQEEESRHLQTQQSYQMQQSYLLQQQQQQQQSYVATVSTDYTNHSSAYPSNTLPYKKPGTGFIETSSILKKHRDEISNEMKPQVFSIDTSHHRPLPAPPSKSQSKKSGSHLGSS